MRSEFEKLPNINLFLSCFKFNETANQYEKVEKGTSDYSLGSFNGAWWAYQKRQTEVDELKKEKSLQELEINQIAHANQQLKLKCDELQKRVEKLQERINDSLEKMDAESSNSWGLWKEKACMYEQGASNAYEKSYWILKGEEND